MIILYTKIFYLSKLAKIVLLDELKILCYNMVRKSDNRRKFFMVIVQEEENFWTHADWDKVFQSYYKPLIESKEIDQFRWEIIDDPNYFKVRRYYWDMRVRGSDDGRRPKQLPPHIKIDAEVNATGGTESEAIEFIQNYRDYWPEGLDLTSYVLGQAKGEEPYMILSFANYEPEENEETEEDECGDIDYAE